MKLKLKILHRVGVAPLTSHLFIARFIIERFVPIKSASIDFISGEEMRFFTGNEADIGMLSQMITDGSRRAFGGSDDHVVRFHSPYSHLFTLFPKPG